MSGQTVNNSGTQNVLDGAATANTTVQNTGVQNVSSGGKTDATAIQNGGVQNVLNGGAAANTAIQSGGKQNLENGSLATGTNIENGGKQNIASGGKATSTTIQSGGEQNVKNGGIVSGATIKKGGTQNTEIGAIVSDVTVEGDQKIQSGSVVSGGLVVSGGTQEIAEGGKAVSTTVSGGTQSILKGAVAEQAIVNHSGVQNVSGAAMKATLSDGGTQNVFAEGKASETVIEKDGKQIVSSGGTAENTKIKENGRQIIIAGAVIKDVTMEQGIIQLGDEEVVVPKPKPEDPAVPVPMALIQEEQGSYIIGGTLDTTKGGTVVFSGKEAGKDLTIENMKGDATFKINTEIAQTQGEISKADHITIKKAETNGNHKIMVNYDAFFETNATSGGILPVPEGAIEIAEVPQGTTMEAEANEWGAYRYTPTLLETTADGKTHYSMDTITEGDLGPSELVYAGMEVAAGSMLTLRQENAALAKRIGELREDGDKQGIWAKVYGGKQEADSLEGREIEQSVSGIAVGYDNKVAEKENGTWYMGYTIGYLKNDLTLETSNGTNKSLSLGLYGAWEGKDGTFGNIMVKQSRMSNDYSSRLKSEKIDGADYKNWGTTLGAEYGYRKQLENNTYIEPMVSLTYGRIGSDSYTTKGGTTANADAMNSLVGKLGLTYGKQMGQINGYVRFVAAREFSAIAKATMYKGLMKPVSVEEDFKQSWLEFALGISGKMGENSNGYLELLRTSEGKTSTAWQVNAGLRWAF